MHRGVLWAWLLVLLPALLHADDIYLKSGGKMSGRILSQTETMVEIDVGVGEVGVPMSSIARIDKKRSTLDDYHDRANVLGADDMKGWLELARWASSQALGTQARQAYQRVLAMDPENAEANTAMGKVQVDGRWMTEEESYRARGFVEFEGEWMTPAAQQAVVAERAAASEAERARMEAEGRAAEAEARAREAEARAQEAANAPYAVSYSMYPVYWGPAWGPGPSTWPKHPGRPQPRPAPSRPPR
jgi:hypothetical protein